MNLLKELLSLTAVKSVTESKKGGLNKDALLEGKVPTISSINFAELNIPIKLPTQLMDVISTWKKDSSIDSVDYVRKGGRKGWLQSLEDLPSLHKTKKTITAINNVDKIIFAVNWKDLDPISAVKPLRRTLANKGYELVDFNQKGIIVNKVREVADEEPAKDDTKAAPKADAKVDAKPVAKKVDAPKVEPKPAPKKVEPPKPAPKKMDAPKADVKKAEPVKAKK